MKEITKALSNKVFLNEDSNTIIKKYSQDKFKQLFGTQELKVLGKLGFNIVNVNTDSIEIGYIDHQPFDDNNISMQDIVSVVNALTELHSVDPKGLNTPGFKKAYDELLIKGEYPVIGPYDQYEESIVNEALTILRKDHQVLLHNDVVEGNLLKVNRKIKLIDFEYSGIGNPIFDLASFATERELSNEQIRTMLNLYKTQFKEKDFIIVCAFLQIFWTRWALFKYETTHKEIYKEIADWKLEQYKKITKNFS